MSTVQLYDNHGMETEKDGCFVLYDDYKALALRLDSVRQLVADLSVSDCSTCIEIQRLLAVESQEIKCCKCGKPTDPISAAAHKDGAGWICRDCFYVPV